MQASCTCHKYDVQKPGSALHIGTFEGDTDKLYIYLKRKSQMQMFSEMDIIMALILKSVAT